MLPTNYSFTNHMYVYKGLGVKEPRRIDML